MLVKYSIPGISTLLTGVALCFLLWGCSGLPRRVIEEADTAYKLLQSLEAGTYAPDLLNAATAKRQELQDELLKQQKSSSPQYDRTTQLANELKQLAEQAKTKAMSAKEQAKADSETALQEATLALNKARIDLSDDDDDLANVLNTVETNLQQAKKYHSEGKYRESQDAANRIKAEAEQVRAITGAIVALREQMSREMDALTDRMREAAKDAAQSKHALSRAENVTQGNWEIIYKSPTRIDFTVNFECHMRGAIIGRDRYLVGVMVTGRMEIAGERWFGKVLGKHVVYDNEIK
jgi:hypothetical protein